MNKTKKTKIAGLVVAILLIIIDQVLKIWAYDNLRLVGTQSFMPSFLRLTYVENTGAAFGIFQNSTFVLGIISAVILLCILAAIFLNKIKGNFLTWTILIIFAGGAGNVIDRLTRGFVIDYLDFEIGFLQNFPVFNFADCCVTIGAILLVVYIIFFDSKSRKKNNVE